MKGGARLALLCLLAGTSGCLGIFGPGEPDPGSLSADARYDWNASADAYIELHANNYTAVHNLSNKTTGGPGTIEIYRRDALGTEQPLPLEALQYRYPNGTRVVYDEGTPVMVWPNGTTAPTSSLGVERTRHRTVISIPASTGKVAYTAPKTGKEMTTPTFVEGAYEVVLPPRTAVAVPLLARVRPGGHTTTRGPDGRTHIRWETVRSRTIVVRYYLDRDLLIFGGMVALLVIAGIVGAGYYLLQIRQLVERRREVGLDVDVTEDDSRRPPPGMP